LANGKSALPLRKSWKSNHLQSHPKTPKTTYRATTRAGITTGLRNPVKKSGTNDDMNELELRSLSDEDIEAKLKTLDPIIRQRTREGGITEQGGKALAESLPYRRERERRAELKRKAEQNAKFDAETAERKANEARFREQLRTYGREIL
jgi:hypothetical protein